MMEKNFNKNVEGVIEAVALWHDISREEVIANYWGEVDSCLELLKELESVNE